MSLINKAKSFATSPQGRQAIRSLTSRGHGARGAGTGAGSGHHGGGAGGGLQSLVRRFVGGGGRRRH